MKRVGIIRESALCRLCRARHNRHSFASMLIANGESLAYIKDQLGHSSIQMTVDIYGHLVPGANRQAVNRLDDPEWKEGKGKTAPQAHPEIQEASNTL